MSSESKILTVSYGTFSCTLEGFENPFDTMKAIAEYFRDLAAQDRHFGAEPPPPDAAMLHRLAEREVSRLAAASQREEALKAADDALAATTVADAGITPRIQFNPVGRRPARNLYQPEAPAEEDAAAPEPSLQDVIPDGVAAKLARIRRAVHPVAADLTAPDLTAPASAFVAEPLADQRGEAVAEETSDLDAAPALSDLDAGDPPEMEPEMEMAEADPVAESVVDLAEDAFEEATPDVAARLGALIASDDSPAIDDIAGADVAEAWTAEGATANLAEAAYLDDGFSDAALESDMLAEADAAAEDLADLAALDGVTFDDAALAAALDDTLPEDAPAEMTLADAEATDPLPEAVDASDVVEAFEVAEALDASPDAPVAAVADVDTDTALAAVDAEPAPRTSRRSRGISSRVVRLHPGEDTGPRDPGATRVLSSQQDSDDVARLMQQAEEVMAEETNRRRQEALSRLKAAVQSTEADRADLDYEAPRADVSLDPYRDDLADAIQPEEPVAPPAPPEVKPRRKSMPVRTQEQPRPGTIRPGMISPPPLVLVSEQRIDRVSPAAAPAGPAPSMAPAMPGIAPANSDGQPMVALRTGRLSGAIGSGAALATSAAPVRNIVLEKPSYGPAVEADDDEDLAEDAREIDESGLAAFAETVGAKSMAEMLEAAAAYATCVEKREQFTRPQLMRRMMASAGGKPVSREDGLRSFGTLLRTGRIEKVTRGHYSLADNSPYLAEARRLN